MSLQSVIAMLETITGHHPQIAVNPAFVRANEIHRLCGDPSKLEACVGQLSVPDFGDTLTWMLTNNGSVNSPIFI